MKYSYLTNNVVLINDKSCYYMYRLITTFNKFASWQVFNSLSNNKILDWSKCKAFADDKINVKIRKLFMVTSIFSFSHNVFKSPSYGGGCH